MIGNVLPPTINRARGVFGIREVYRYKMLGQWPGDSIAALVCPPEEVEGYYRHFAARSITGKVDNDAISQWDDLSGNADHATQATGANQPLYKTSIVNGLPVVRFDGTNDRMNFGEIFDANTDVGHVFIVAKCNGTGAQGLLGNRLNGSGTVGWSIRYNGATTLEAYFPGATAVQQKTIADQFNVLEVIRHPGSHYLRVNGSADGPMEAGRYLSSSANATVLGAEQQGNTSFLNGDIAEIVIYNAILAEPFRMAVVNWLMRTYAIT